MKTIAIALSIIFGMAVFGRDVRATEPPRRIAALFPSEPTVFELVSVANYYIALGEEETFAEVSRRWKADPENPYLREEISWLCRLLYIPRGTTSLRAPLFGEWRSGFGPDSFEEKDWPSFPLFQGNEVFFLFPANYFLAGIPEDPINYLTFNRTNGSFRKKLLAVPSEEEARRTLDVFFASHAWTNIKWIETPFAMCSPEELVPYFRAQTKIRANQRHQGTPESAPSSSTEPVSRRP